MKRVEYYLHIMLWAVCLLCLPQSVSAKDRNRGITGITYDLSHNPQTIVMNGGQIVNDYTSDGRKLCSTQSTGMTTTTDMYVDGLIIRNGAPLMWQFDGGYVSLGTNSVPQSWNYYITDHLGSTRMVVDSQNNIKETINYYPYGSEMTMAPPAQLTSNPNWQPYRFTGKELVRQNGLNMYDFGARWYDVAGVPMWTSMDPLCEKYYDVSPYVYCLGNPINLFDSDGREVLDRLFTKSTGEETTKQNYLYNIHDNDNAIILMAHGSITGTGIIIAENNVIRDEKIGMPYEMEKYLDDNSKIWEMGNISSIAPEIVLFSCGTGASGKFAQTISYDETFKDIKIYAPSDDINIHPNGTCSIDNGGYWCEYVNGELTNTYSDSFVPGTKEFSEASYWEKMNKIEIDWTKK